MSLDVLLLACLCGAAASGAPTSLRDLSKSELDDVHKGLDGVETTTTQVLFGDLVAAVEETIDDESASIKGFKPGTNAQRHRLHRIQ